MTKSTKNEKTQAVTPAATTQTRRYDEVFKQQAVENWIKTGKAGTQIAQELGISYPSLKEWKRRYHGDAVPQRDDLAAENRALKAELARVHYHAWIQAGASQRARTDAALLPTRFVLRSLVLHSEQPTRAFPIWIVNNANLHYLLASSLNDRCCNKIRV